MELRNHNYLRLLVSPEPELKWRGEFYWPDQLTARERSVAMKTRPEFNPARLAK